MSMDTAIIYGYGFDATGISENALIAFIKNHLETVLKLKMARVRDEEVIKVTRDNLRRLFDRVTREELQTAEIDDFEDMCNKYPEITENLSLLTDDPDLKQFRDIVAEIIAYETDIGVQYERAQTDECRGYPSILLPEAMPWQYNETEKNLTQEAFEEAMKPYLEELWMEGTPVEDILVEYFG